MNHFTMSTPDVPACKRFWIDFLGGAWYSESFRLIQVLIGGILVDFFPPLDPADKEAVPAPGSPIQRFRFAITPDQVAPWLERAEAWRVPPQMLVQDKLLRLGLVFEAPGGYHVALEATYPSLDALHAAEAQIRDRVSRLAAIAEPFTADQEPVTAGRA
jgi:hypothetical protein